ncbi:MAG: hypothetical protein M3Q07_25050 [Pseudobdellovibrionaceae bacterium]|nr:hypothetical protein [Pseudobdellovibrionaceae bacterium]
MNFFSVNCADKKGQMNISLVFGEKLNAEESHRLFLCESRHESLTGIVHTGTKTSYDAVSNSCVVPTLYSERFFKILEQIKATGYRRVPVELFTVSKEKISGFSALCVEGRCGPIDWARSTPFMAAPPVPHGKGMLSFRGIPIPIDSWDGSDFFTPGGTRNAFVTERIANALSDAGLNNISIEPLNERVSHLTDAKIIEVFGVENFYKWNNASSI